MRNLRWLFFLLLVGLLIGCGGKRKVNGKILKDGQPFKVSDKGVISLSFVSADDASKMYNATPNMSDGTFTIVGPDGKGIPPGKYKVQLSAQDPYTGPGSKDLFGGKYASATSSPLTVDVGATDVVVDLK